MRTYQRSGSSRARVARDRSGASGGGGAGGAARGERLGGPGGSLHATHAARGAPSWLASQRWASWRAASSAARLRRPQ